MSDLYNELLKATDNLQDITFTKYATITNITDDKCTVKETEQDLTHNNVPILNGLNLKTGDTVIIGFVNNSLYNPIIIGSTGEAQINTQQIIESSAFTNIGTSANATQHEINTKINEKINSGGGSGSVIMVGSFEINSEGHLIATIPNCSVNPYSINNNGHLIYDTEAI